jgi:hypothetical protein
MTTSNSFARITSLVLGHLRGEARPRAKHQVRIGTPERFEDRITPTTIAIAHTIPYVPPGQVVSYTNAMGFDDNLVHSLNGISQDFGLNPTANTLTPVIQNNTGVTRYVTFAIYTAPGGGEATTSNAYDNLASQKLVFSVTVLVPKFNPQNPSANTVTLPTIDVTSLKLTGQQKFQCDFFDANQDPNGYAPNKPKESDFNNVIIDGELFDYDNSNGTPGQIGPGR